MKIEGKSLRKVIKDLGGDIRYQKKYSTAAAGSESIKALKEDSGKPWPYYDSSARTIAGKFDAEIQTKGFQKYLQERFRDKIGSLVGVELGGPGSKFFADLEGTFAKTLGVTLTDLRQGYQTNEERNKDELNHHTVLEADMFSKNAIVLLDSWLSGDKVDFIFETLEGGWGSNSENMTILGKYLARYYERLSDDGCMFLQTPFVTIGSGRHEIFKEYNRLMELFKGKYGDKIDIQWSTGSLRIEKKKGSPQTIEAF